MLSKIATIERIYSILKPLAHEQTPEGSEVNAVLDQWFHAIATENDFFASDRNKSIYLKKQVIALLKSRKLYTNRRSFFDFVFEEVTLKPLYDSNFTFVDLFAGIGGLRLGFQKNGGSCVFSSEFDKHAQSTYKKNYGELPFGDITKVIPHSIPNHDVLLAGFPCQPFSNAGLKLGIEDTRGTLFYDIAKILEAKKPPFALLENVKGLISHNNGTTLRTILKTLSSIGYKCNISEDIIFNGSAQALKTEAKKMILKSIDFGIPQNRQRIYIVLWRSEKIKLFDYPTPIHQTCKVGDILDPIPDNTLTISDRLWEGHQRRKKDNQQNGKGFGFSLFDESAPYTSTISARYYKDGSEILIAQKNANPRKISPREAARLQGFPEEFILNESKVQAYKQLGNSVTVNVVDAIAKKICSYLGEI